MDPILDSSILPDDPERVRVAVAIWKGPEHAQASWGARIADHATAWSRFVDTDWNGCECPAAWVKA